MSNEFDRDEEFYRRLWRREVELHRLDMKRANKRWATLLAVLILGGVGIYAGKSYAYNHQDITTFCPAGFTVSREYVKVSPGDTVNRIMANVSNDVPMMLNVPRASWKKAIMQSNGMLDKVELDCIKAGDTMVIPVITPMVDAPELDEYSY